VRLCSLTVRDFKNLRNISFDFDEATPITVVVGRNGTGKSNLLEALTIIFRDLDLGSRPRFAYQLEYLCRGHRVRVDADPDRSTRRVIHEVDGAHIAAKDFVGAEERRHLPNFVFGYYSGPNNRMEEHFLTHQERFYRSLLDGDPKPLRPLFYAQPVHSQFVLLAFFIEEDEKVREFLRDYLRIEGLESALFVMREPEWTSREGDPRFWNAKGTVSTLLDRLYKFSLAPLRRSRRVDIGFRRTTTLEHLYLYQTDVDAIRLLAATYPNQQEFFKALESTLISKLLSEVRIRVRAKDVGGSLTFRELSEGEQQLLMVLGLLRFTGSSS
jgi:energy-coupling factor transporter ATP-binding protein EcfA2